MIRHKITKTAMLAGVISAALMVGAALAGSDVGQQNEQRLGDKAKDLFGFDKPVAASSTVSADLAAARANPTKLVTLAKGLKARVITSGNFATICVISEETSGATTSTRPNNNAPMATMISTAATARGTRRAASHAIAGVAI